MPLARSPAIRARGQGTRFPAEEGRGGPPTARYAGHVACRTVECWRGLWRVRLKHQPRGRCSVRAGTTLQGAGPAPDQKPGVQGPGSSSTSSDVAKGRITDYITRVPGPLGPGLIPGRLLSRTHLLALTRPVESAQDVSQPCGLKKGTALGWPMGATQGPGHQEYCVNMPRDMWVSFILGLRAFDIKL